MPHSSVLAGADAGPDLLGAHADDQQCASWLGVLARVQGQHVIGHQVRRACASPAPQVTMRLSH